MAASIETFERRFVAPPRFFAMHRWFSLWLAVGEAVQIKSPDETHRALFHCGLGQKPGV